MTVLSVVQTCCPTPGCSRFVPLPLYKGDNHTLCEECEADVKPRKCKMKGCTGSLRECRALPPRLEICWPCRTDSHRDHHAGRWAYFDDTHGVVCNCERCEPGFDLKPTEKTADVGVQLRLGLDLKWSELKPKRAKQKPIDGDLFGGGR